MCGGGGGVLGNGEYVLVYNHLVETVMLRVGKETRGRKTDVLY